MKILLLRLRCCCCYTLPRIWGCSNECALQCDDANADEHKSREIMSVSCEVRFQKRTEGFPICVCVCVSRARADVEREARNIRARITHRTLKICAGCSCTWERLMTEVHFNFKFLCGCCTLG